MNDRHDAEIKCPSCGYIRTEGDSLVLKSICPSCGIVYAKWQSSEKGENDSFALPDEPKFIEYDESETRQQHWFSELFLSIPKDVDTTVFWGYSLIYTVFFFWGWSFILTGLSWEPIMNSFMHNINLPFHEFGHVLFRPFGHFMTILGGSLFQLMMPLIVTFAFLIKKRDTFAASITVWWFGQSFIDLSPYIADATYRGLPLIAGMGEEAHDWGNLLTMLDMLEYDYLIANASFGIGSVIIISSMVWGAYLLYKMFIQCFS